MTRSAPLSVDDTLGSDDYDEFGLLHENAAECGIPFHDPPVVERRTYHSPAGGRVSYIRWGQAEPEVVFLHGGAQNAHTWDSCILALDRPAAAVDLPGHGHSDRRADRNYGPWQNASTLADLLGAELPSAKAVVGMSLGGATTIRLAATRPDVCRRAVVIDVTPQINDPARRMSTAERGSVDLLAGPPVYESFEAMAAAAVALSPQRAASAIRRGVRHNARRNEDGTWTWRHDLLGSAADARGAEAAANWTDFTPLWDDIAVVTVPTLFVRGELSPYVRDEDVAELRRRLPSVRTLVVPGAGHAVQSDQPLALVAALREFVYAPGS